MATLVYSDKCRNCYELIEYIKTKPPLHTIVRYQHVDDGVPNGVTKVPSLITSDGMLYVGNQIRPYLQTLAPDKIERVSLGGKLSTKRLDNQSNGKYFSVNDYGKRIVTSTYDPRIERSVMDNLSSLKR
jgi:predicted thioredoxin/glutaredoxin